MTARQKANAEEQRLELFRATHWTSVVSGEPLSTGVPQLAHRVAKTKANLMKWGPEVINHPLNLVPVRDLRENSFCNIGNRPMEARDLMERIIRVMTGRESEPDMAEEYARLREDFKGKWRS